MSNNFKDGEDDLRAIPTNITLTPEVFEKLYLAPKTQIAGELRKTFGNPTPVAVMGFVMALTPLSIALMGWRGAAGAGAATTGDSIWFGGVLLLIAGFLEFILGNTFPSVVFLGYGAHFLTYATTFIPWFNAVGAFTTDNSQTQEPAFLSSMGFYFVSMCILSFIFLICALRTNVVFVFVFVTATLGFGLGSGAFFSLAAGQLSLGETLLVATGGSFFVTSLFGWYFFVAIMLASMDLPSVPVCDLSTVIKGVSERKAKFAKGADAD